ncbi:MAG TPA: hypothetical protein VN666_09110 [Nitrospira sp.]|nr:hypothetical protein [Nitrospira sp.]
MATAVELRKDERTGRNRLERDTLSESVHCSRCRGLMVVEQGFDSMLGSSEADVALRRCVQCGEVVDPVILRNRRLQHGSERERIQE